MSLKALGLDETLKSVLMETISIQKTRFWGSPTFKNQEKGIDSLEETIIMRQELS